MRLFLLMRHAESLLNVERRVNGDPRRDVPLTERGEAEARAAGAQLANVALDLCVVTRFPRTRLTAAIVLAGRDVPVAEEPLLDDVDVGDLEGAPIDEYRAWKRGRPRHVPFPGGESLDAAARRYAAAFRRLVAGPHERVLAVVHEIPVRYAVNGAAGSDQLDGPAHEIPNAVPYLFDERALARASETIERLTAAAPAAAARPPA